MRPYLKKKEKKSQKGLAEWLKVKTLSLSPNITKKRKGLRKEGERREKRREGGKERTKESTLAKLLGSNLGNSHLIDYSIGYLPFCVQISLFIKWR
jgi:hypothetical protein